MPQYTVPEVPGSSRISERPYSHAIIGRRNGTIGALHVEAKDKAEAAQNRRWDTKHWNDEKRASEALVGQRYLNHNNFMVVAADYNVEIGKRFMAEHPTLEGYLQHQEQMRRDYVEKLRAEGVGELYVLQWSMSFKNAAKAIGSFDNFHSDLRIVETAIVEKPARKRKAAAAEGAI